MCSNCVIFVVILFRSVPIVWRAGAWNRNVSDALQFFTNAPQRSLPIDANAWTWVNSVDRRSAARASGRAHRNLSSFPTRSFLQWNVNYCKLSCNLSETVPVIRLEILKNKCTLIWTQIMTNIWRSFWRNSVKVRYIHFLIHVIFRDVKNRSVYSHGFSSLFWLVHWVSHRDKLW